MWINLLKAFFIALSAAGIPSLFIAFLKKKCEAKKAKNDKLNASTEAEALKAENKRLQIEAEADALAEKLVVDVEKAFKTAAKNSAVGQATQKNGGVKKRIVASELKAFYASKGLTASDEQVDEKIENKVDLINATKDN